MVFVCFGMLLVVEGCGRSQNRPVPVSGRVTIRGQPVADVLVHFVSATGKHVGTGRTAADGTFKVDNGALPGDNKVYLAPVVELPPGVDETAAAAGVVASRQIKTAIPPQYLDPMKPALSFNVPAGGTDQANFEL